MKKLVFVCFVFLALCGVVQAQLDQTDNQQWTDIQVAVPMTKTVDFNVLGTLRLGRNITHSVDERIGVGFTFRFGKYLTVAPNYLHIGMQPFEGRRIWENRLTLPVTVRFNLDKFRLSDRNQLERRMRNSGLKSTRYRNRFQVEHPVGPDDMKLSLFVADEVFYESILHRWSRNRFTVGASKVFNSHYTQDIYYLRQNDGISIPGDLNVIGATIRLKL